MKKIYLASASPRRKQLLEQIGIKPIICVSDYEEHDTGWKSPQEMVVKHAEGKAKDVAAKFSNGIVIAADTVVVFENRVLGKPDSRQKAMEMLSSLSGQIHYVYTGICIIDKGTNRIFSDYEETAVAMRVIMPNEIEAYLNTEEPYDKAGAYGIQGRAGMFVERISGCYHNVMGLPIAKVASMLTALGVDICDRW